jgi:hypothetical protein
MDSIFESPDLSPLLAAKGIWKLKGAFQACALRELLSDRPVVQVRTIVKGLLSQARELYDIEGVAVAFYDSRRHLDIAERNDLAAIALDFVKEHRSRKWDQPDPERAKSIDFMCGEIEKVLAAQGPERKRE